MKIVRSFEDYCNEGVIRKITPDPHRARSLLASSDRKLRSLRLNLEKVGVTNDNANDHAESCYDILLLLVRAHLYQQGYAGSGQGAHEAEIAYLQTLHFPETEVGFLDQLRYFRNGILYYGTTIDIEYAQTVIAFTNRMQPKLRKLLEK